MSTLKHHPSCASLNRLLLSMPPQPAPCDCNPVEQADEPTLKRPLQSAQCECNEMYVIGWNSALEMAAFKLVNDFKKSFGDDTLASIAVYLKQLKKETQ